jgi:hypothetical protein
MSSQLQLGLVHRSVRWCTGQCPVVCARLNSGEQAALGRSRRRTAINHRTVRWYTGQCPVSQWSAGQLSAAQSARDAWPSQRSDGGTGLSGVHRTVSGVHRTVSGAPTAPGLQRSSAPVMEGNRAPDCLVRHPTEGKICLPGLLPTAPRPLVPIKGTPRRLKHENKCSQQV